jgi:hypothetical protein
MTIRTGHRPTAKNAARFLAAAWLTALCVPASAATGKVTRLEINYAISIKGLTIGKVNAEMRFTDKNYASAVSGAVTGLARLFSDANAKLASSGHIQGSRVVPDSYDGVTTESDYESRVSMAMRGGAITELSAEPPNKPAPDRVPILPSHKRNVLDPLSAFLIVLGKPGKPQGAEVCNRTVKVFDGWSRYDIVLNYKETKKVGSDNAKDGDYSGDVFVCTARYVPVSGHRENGKAVKDMEENPNLGVWLAPIGDSGMLAPYRLTVGTSAGDLTLRATKFAVTTDEKRASAN